MRVLAEVQAASEALGDLAKRDFRATWRFHEVVAAVHRLCGVVAAAEEAGIGEDLIVSAVETARSIHGRSPFISRLQRWPRGYPGDFETIDYLIKQQVQAEPNTIEFWLEYLALNSPIAQQHRNKVCSQALEVRSILATLKTRTRILVLAAGGSPDLMLVQDSIADSDCQVVLNDRDTQALEFSLANLPKIRDRITLAPGNVLAKGSTLAKLEPFDLVLVGGLLDYLPERQASALIRMVSRRLLTDSGSMFFTNIAQNNPYRPWIEYLANWRLIERSEADLRRLLRSAGFGFEAVDSRRDGTGLTWLVSVRRAWA